MSGLVRIRFEAGRAQLGELARLVLGERLGRVEVERPRLRLARDRVQHRQVEGEALARGGAGGDDQVRGRRRLPGAQLVRVERLDPGGAQARDEVRGELGGERDRLRGAVRFRGLGDDPPVAAGRGDRDAPLRVDDL
jgi:hypothetical protein